MVQCQSQTEPAEPHQGTGVGEIKASRSQPLLQTLLTQGPRGCGAYHMVQAEHAWRGRSDSTWIPGTKGKVALLHEDLEALVLCTLHCATSNVCRLPKERKEE